jgi:hypothetical protein
LSIWCVFEPLECACECAAAAPADEEAFLSQEGTDGGESVLVGRLYPDVDVGWFTGEDLRDKVVSDAFDDVGRGGCGWVERVRESEYAADLNELVE